MVDNQKEVKKTELGTFPKDWRLVPIKELAKISTGDKNTEDKVSDGKYPFFVRSANVERINSYSFDGEAVLTAGDGVGTGKIFHYINDKFDYHQRVYKMSNFSPEVNGYYFYLCFRNYFYDRVMGMTAKSSVDSVRMEMIADMVIPLPPTLKEQQAIASALSDVDELIRSLDQLIDKKEAIKKGTMQQLLTGKKRLPGFDGDWEVKVLGDVLSVQHGKSQKQVEAKDGDYPILATGGQIGKATEYLYNKPSVLIGRKGTIDRPQYIDTPFWTIDTLFYTEVKKNAIPKFLYYKFLLIDWRSYNEASGVPSLNSSTIENVEVNLPSELDEQKAIVDVLDDMDRELQTLRQKRDKMRRVKEGMMQELLTGKTRLVKQKAAIYQMPQKRNEKFENAVLIATIIQRFETDTFKLNRFRYQKYVYLLKRYLRASVKQFMKKTAGAYSPKMRYRGGESLAIKKKYIEETLHNGYECFTLGNEIDEALYYYNKWYDEKPLLWLDQLQFSKSGELELLTTVDMAMQDILKEGKKPNLYLVKEIIKTTPKWKHKLKKPEFTDAGIEEGIQRLEELFSF